MHPLTTPTGTFLRGIVGAGLLATACIYHPATLSRLASADDQDLGDGTVSDTGPYGPCTTQELVVLTSQDDLEIEPVNGVLIGGERPDSEPWALYIGNWSMDDTVGAFRFALTSPLAAGSTVTGLRLSLWGVAAAGTWNGNPLEIGLEDSADAATVTDAAESPWRATGIARPLVAVNNVTTSRWPLSGELVWTANAFNTGPNLAAAGNELLNRHTALAAGAHIGVWLRGLDPTVEAEVGTCDLDLPACSSPTAARLEIVSCVPDPS